MDRDLVLASTSRYRRMLLDRLHLPFSVVAPRYVEGAITGAPADVAKTHALGKATSVRSDSPNALIIGSDQVVDHRGRILGKPGDADTAAAQLFSLQNDEHRLITAVAVVDAHTGRREQAVDVTRIRLRALTHSEIAAYVAIDRPFDCAGSYRAEALGITLFEAWHGADPTAVVGLPLMTLSKLLRSFGVDPLVPSSGE